MSKIKFLVFEKAYIIRKGIASLIDEFENCEIIIEDIDNEHLYSLIQEHKPNAVIINMDLFQIIPANLISRVKTELKCKFIGIGPEINSLKNDLIDEYLSFFEDKADLLKKLNFFIDDFNNTQKQRKNHGIKKTDHELSIREKDVVALVAKGLTNKEIADNLFISIHTAMTHRKNIARKLGIKTVSGITVYAILNKLIDMMDLK